MACTFLQRKKDRPRCKRPSHPKILYKVRRNVSEAVPARFFVPCTERRTPWQTTNFCSPRRSTPTTITTPRKFRSLRDWKRCASARACTSARPPRAVCTTSSMRSSITPSTKPSRATARTSPCRSIPTTPSPSSITAAASPWTFRRRPDVPRSRSSLPSCTRAASSAAGAIRSPAACTASARASSTRCPNG